MSLRQEVNESMSAIEVNRRILTSIFSCFSLSRSSVRASLPVNASVHSTVPSGFVLDWNKHVRQKALEPMTTPQKTDSVSNEPTILPFLVSTTYASFTSGLVFTSRTTLSRVSRSEVTSTSCRIPCFDSPGLQSSTRTVEGCLLVTSETQFLGA